MYARQLTNKVYHSIVKQLERVGLVRSVIVAIRVGDHTTLTKMRALQAMVATDTRYPALEFIIAHVKRSNTNAAVQLLERRLRAPNGGSLVDQVRERVSAYSKPNGREFTRTSHAPSTHLQFQIDHTPARPPFPCAKDTVGKQYIKILFDPTYLKIYDIFLVVAYDAEWRPVVYAACEWKPHSLHIHLLCSNHDRRVTNGAVAMVHFLEEEAVRNGRKLVSLESLSKPYDFYHRLGFRRTTNACVGMSQNELEESRARYAAMHYQFYSRPRTQAEIQEQAKYQQLHLPGNFPGTYVMSKCIIPVTQHSATSASTVFHTALSTPIRETTSNTSQPSPPPPLKKRKKS
jgi:hypothetical protein